MYELVIILFLISFVINISLGILRIKVLFFSSQEQLQLYDFTRSSKYQMYNQLFNIVRDSLVNIILLALLVFRVPAYIDSILSKLSFSARLTDVFTILSLLLVSTIFMFTFDSIKYRFLKFHSYIVIPPTKKLFSLWCVRFLLILPPTMVFVVIFNSLNQNSDKVIMSFVTALVIGIISFNLYLKFTYKLDKSHKISFSKETEKLINETINLDFQIYKIITPNNEKLANAFAIKIKKEFQILISEDMLDILDEHETLSIIAHEIGHHIKKHNIKFKLLLIVQFLYLFLISNFVLVIDDLYNSFGYDRVSGAFAAFTAFILFGFFNRFFLIISNYISRRFEYSADLYSNEVNGGDYLSNALLKVYQFNLMTPNLHVIDEFLNSTHPSLINRLKAIKYVDEINNNE